MLWTSHVRVPKEDPFEPFSHTGTRANLEVGFDEIDQYLSKMTPDHLDRAVAAAGFDPAMETRRGIGMREKVVMAIAEKRGDEE
jgi:hypothetical protein